MTNNRLSNILATHKLKRKLKARKNVHRATHYELMNEENVNKRDKLDFEVLYAFFAYLHESSDTDNHPIEQLIQKINIQIKELGLEKNVSVDMEKDFHDSNKRGALKIYIYGITLVGTIKTIDSEKFDRSIFFNNNRTVTGFELNFSNVAIDDSIPSTNKYLKLRVSGRGSDFKKFLKIDNSCFSSYGVYSDTFTDISIERSASISPLVVGEQTEAVTLSHSTVIDLKVTSEVLTHLSIKNTQIRSISEKFFVNLMERLRFLQFDHKSIVLFNGYSAYKNFRQVALKNQDRIQSFVIYKKELEAFSKEEGLDLDSRLLLFFNNLANGNGTSIRLPLFWLFGFNLFFTLAIIIVEMYSGNLIPLHFSWNFLDVLPIHAFTDDSFSYVAKGIDGLRRVFCSIFIFLTVSSALRFRYKG